MAKTSTAIGPVWISNLHLKKLAHGTFNYLTNIFNMSISNKQIPEIWHKAIIISILKPGKDNYIGNNWRTISLICPAAKTLEKLLLPKILTHIPFHPAQHDLGLPKLSNIIIHLKSLHWLPVKVRSTYKIACLCYHCHSSTAPSYVTDMLHKKPLHTCNTRSSSYTMPLLNRPAHSKATLGDRSFSFASSSVWNSIPNDVRCAPSLSSFKSRLRTYLFR